MRAAIATTIQAMVDLETKGWDTKNPELFLSMIHEDMAWPFPPTADSHDPVDWVFVMGRFDRERWRRDWQGLFDTHNLIHNRRVTVKIDISKEEDAAFAVVDIDTLWRHKETKADFHWKGRVCKIYTKLRSGEWKFYYQTGALNFPPQAR
jgi:ketosteroid isomerase-like protein